MMPGLASITPQYVEMVLRGAIAGSHVQQWEMFDLMLDTWPELAACQQELVEGVMGRKLTFTAWSEEGEAPTPTAMERLKVVSSALRSMQPDPCADENDLDGTIKDILDGWFRGVTCLEIDWHMASAGTAGSVLAPRATFWGHPSHFAWGVDGRLGLRQGTGVVPMPPNKFLVGIHKAKSGSALGGALLRPLAWWWCAANFSSDWLLNLAQIFGLPFRWANHDPNASQGTVDAICNMLQNMGSAGWAAFPAGTTLELKDAGAAGDHSPQGDLLDRADRYARMLILGQTMSGSQDSSKGGGKAFGSVESKVKDARTDAASKYACKVISQQLAPAVLVLNYGNADECPCVDLVPDDEAGTNEATRDSTLAKLMPIPLSYLRAKYGIPEPAKGEETTGKTEDAKTQDTRKEDPADPADPTDPEDPAAPAKPDEKDDAGDLAAKLGSLLANADDAVFAKALATLTESFA